MVNLVEEGERGTYLVNVARRIHADRDCFSIECVAVDIEELDKGLTQV